uniref:Uncharacterized protein n=1 Tax=Timema poppense TaxID=170557 RepID=A0A7R9DJP8_TIMPO|nr:unnamed protein product [Timema poppensis]
MIEELRCKLKQELHQEVKKVSEYKKNQSEKENINRNTNMFEESVSFDDQPHNESQQDDALISQQSKCANLNDNRENNSEINLEPAEIIISQGHLTNKESQDTISNEQYSSVTTDSTHCLNISENCQETVGSNNYNMENLRSSDFQKEIADPPENQEGTKEPGSLSQGKDGEDISSPASTQYYSQGTIEEDYNINNQENNLGEYYNFVSPPEGPQKNFQDGAESFVYPVGEMNYDPVSPADGGNSVDSYVPVLSPDVPMNFETWDCNPSDEPKSGFNFGGFNFGPTTGQSSNAAALFGGRDNQSKAGETNKANDGFNFNFDNKKSKTSSMFSLFS